jgi:hypothetical protein
MNAAGGTLLFQPLWVGHHNSPQVNRKGGRSTAAAQTPKRVQDHDVHVLSMDNHSGQPFPAPWNTCRFMSHALVWLLGCLLLVGALGLLLLLVTVD